MAPTTVRLVLVEGEDADGSTVEEDCIQVDPAGTSAEHVIGAVLGTREAAYEGGYRLSSTGVTWTEPREVGALRDALDARDIRGVMLVAPLLAAAALTQTVGHALGYAHTALLFVETGSATLAVVDTADGAIVDLHRQLVPCSPYGAQAAADLAAMIQRLDQLEARPEGVFIVGCGVDIVPIKQHLEAASPLPVSVPEEPAMALARGAALASANAPLFASSTAALAYAQDPGTGEVKRRAAYLNVDPGANVASGALAYSAVPDEDGDRRHRHRPFLLVGSAAAAVLVIGIVALGITLASDLRPADQPPDQGANAVVPTKQAPPSTHPPVAAAPATPPAAPPPAAVPPPAPAPPPETIPAPAPVVRQSPQHANPAPVRQTPRPAPAYVPPAAQEAPPPEAPPPPPSAAPAPPPPAAPAPPPPPQMPPMTMYLHLPFVTVPIPINPPPPPPPPGP